MHMIFPQDTNQLQKTLQPKLPLALAPSLHHVPSMLSHSLWCPSESLVLQVNGTPDTSPLQDFAIETDMLLSYDSVHYQNYSVNHMPIHCAFRAQAGISAVSQKCS